MLTAMHSLVRSPSVFSMVLVHPSAIWARQMSAACLSRQSLLCISPGR